MDVSGADATQPSEVTTSVLQPNRVHDSISEAGKAAAKRGLRVKRAASPVNAVVEQSPKRLQSLEKNYRILVQPGFVLHSYPYKETSLIIDFFSRDHGRVALVAKGAKRPHSALRGVLQTFQPLSVGWSGKAEIRTLIGVEWVGGLLPLEKSALLCGFYLNELLVKLLARDDPHPTLFNHYVSTLNQLAHGEAAPIVLRRFERVLLKETGVAVDLTLCTTTRSVVTADAIYVVDPERGVRLARPGDPWPQVRGQTLLDMECGNYADATTLVQSKLMMRALLAHHLGGTPLNTRQILIDLMQL
ncbi:MAG: DNA repair protein RecO [Glaciimonas sp.]|nr:DNA repair protein RecO [Glaciimonas sp.]